MAKIFLIVAYGPGGVIGSNGDLPGWNLREDLKNFKKFTKGKSVNMGRKTFESLPGKKPLPGRFNIICTRDGAYAPPTANDDTYVFTDFLSGIKKASELSEEVFIIGGGEIYKLALELDIVDKIIATEVEGSFEGDTFFHFDKNKWNEEISLSYKKNEENSHDFKIVVYTRP